MGWNLEERAAKFNSLFKDVKITRVNFIGFTVKMESARKLL